MAQEHMVTINVTTDEETVQYKIKLNAELLLFKCKHYHPGGFEFVSYSKEETFYAKPRSLNRALKRKLRKAQKRYNAIMALRDRQEPYNKQVNLTHKL